MREMTSQLELRLRCFQVGSFPMIPMPQNVAEQGLELEAVLAQTSQSPATEQNRSSEPTFGYWRRWGQQGEWVQWEAALVLNQCRSPRRQ